MFRFEIKKVFSRTGSRIALGMLVLILAVICWFAADVSYVNEKGDTEQGISAVRRLREAQKEWAGVVDEEKVRQVIRENTRIRNSPEYRSEDVRQQEIAYSWGQGIMDLRRLLNCFYEENFRSYDYYLADGLSEEDAPEFYGNRVRLLREWLSGEAKDQFSDAEKEYLIREYEELKTPFYYDYMKGWEQLLEYSPTVIMITVLILGYLVAGIFSGEYQLKADAVFFSSLYGRNRATAAKVQAGFAIVTGIYWVQIALYTAFVLLYLGADGANCPVQITLWGWKCFYNISLWQAYGLAVLGGYLGCLFLTFAAMLTAAKSRSAVLAVIVPFAAIFLPSFLSDIPWQNLGKVLALLPDRLLQVFNALPLFELYNFGGRVAGAIPILFVVYVVLTALLPRVIYEVYRRTK